MWRGGEGAFALLEDRPPAPQTLQACRLLIVAKAPSVHKGVGFWSVCLADLIFLT